MNAVEIEQAISDLALQPFDAAGVPLRLPGRLRQQGHHAQAPAHGQQQRLGCARWRASAQQHPHRRLPARPRGRHPQRLAASPATAKAKAKFILATDGQTLEAEELASGETIACAYPDFPNHFGFFLPLAGISTIKEIKDNPIDVRATGRLNKLYVELLRENPDWARPKRRADMNHFMARLVFCFFAEDTDIFNGEGLFTTTWSR
jgi:hypothetical protein